MPRRNFNIEEGWFNLQKDDEIHCHSRPVQSFREFNPENYDDELSHSLKFICNLDKMSEKNQPHFQMGEFEDITVESARSKIHNTSAVPKDKRIEQMELGYTLDHKHECQVVKKREHGHGSIGKILDCQKSSFPR